MPQHEAGLYLLAVFVLGDCLLCVSCCIYTEDIERPDPLMVNPAPLIVIAGAAILLYPTLLVPPIKLFKSLQSVLVAVAGSGP